MTMINTAAPRLSLGTETRLPGLVARLVGGWTAWTQRRATYRALDRLSDRELADIGLTRDDVEALR